MVSVMDNRHRRLANRIWCIERPQAWYEGINSFTDARFKANFRVTKRTFRFLCDRLTMMGRQDTTFRQCVSIEKRVAIGLYKLASSAEYRTISNLFGVGKSTVCEILHEFNRCVNEFLQSDFIQFPTTEAKIRESISGFENLWGFPQCIGSVDGCHIEIQPPKEQSFAYFNYKSFNSIVLLAVCDYNYKFSYINVGSPGRNNDAFIYNNSSVKRTMETYPIYKEMARQLSNKAVPVCLIGDSAFPLSVHLMKP